MGTDETKETFKMYESATTQFKAYEEERFNAWCKAIESVGQEKLNQPLLAQYDINNSEKLKQPFPSNPDKLPLLRVNFDGALVKLLREVKYFRLIDLVVPDSAIKIYERTEIFRQQTGNLELIVNVYNKILLTIQAVERRMLQKRLSDIDSQLQKGLKSLTWKSIGINEFITTAMTLVKECSDILASINTNVAEMKLLLRSLKDNAMFERKDAKTNSIEDFQFAHETLVDKRHAEAMTVGEKIHKLVLASNKILKISKGHLAWKDYLGYLTDIVVNGLSDAVQATLAILINNLDGEYLTKHELTPMLEIKLELEGSLIIFTPSIDPEMDSGNELRNSINKWIKDYMNIAKFLARIDTEQNEGDYLMEVRQSAIPGRSAHAPARVCQASVGRLPLHLRACAGRLLAIC